MRLELATILTLMGATLDPGRASTDPSQDAYLEGRDALRERRDKDALRAFSDAVARALSPVDRWKGLIGLGLTYELIGDATSAWHHYRRFLRESELDPAAEPHPWPRQRARVAETVSRLEEALLTTHARLNLDSAPPRAVIAIAPSHLHDCGGAPCTFFLLPGDYEISCSWPELGRGTLSLSVDAGDRQEALCRPPARVVDTVAAGAGDRGGGWPLEATVLIASGGALLIAGGVASALAADDCDTLESLSTKPGTDEVLARYDRIANRVEDRRLAAGVLYGIGGAAVIGGILYGVLAPDDEPMAAVETTPHGVRLRATMRF